MISEVSKGLWKVLSGPTKPLENSRIDFSQLGDLTTRTEHYEQEKPNETEFWQIMSGNNAAHHLYSDDSLDPLSPLAFGIDKINRAVIRRDQAKVTMSKLLKQ